MSVFSSESVISTWGQRRLLREIFHSILADFDTRQDIFQVRVQLNKSAGGRAAAELVLEDMVDSDCLQKTAASKAFAHIASDANRKWILPVQFLFDTIFYNHPKAAYVHCIKVLEVC